MDLQECVDYNDESKWNDRSSYNNTTILNSTRWQRYLVLLRHNFYCGNFSGKAETMS